MAVIYCIGNDIPVQTLSELYRRAGLDCPIDDLARLARMIQHADLMVSAWDGDKLVGVARCVTDFEYCCYLSELAVDPDYQGSGIGRELVRRTREHLGGEVKIILLSVPSAVGYYQKLGFVRDGSAFVMLRKSEIDQGSGLPSATEPQ